MTDAQYTRCPQCQTFFRVTPSQLKKAKGKVRCGNCSHVFDARGHLLDAIPAANSPVPAKKTSPAAPPAKKTPPPVKVAPPRTSKPPQFIDSIIDDRSRYNNLDKIGTSRSPAN